MATIATDSIAVIDWQGDQDLGPEFDRRGRQFHVSAWGQELVDPSFPIVRFRLRDEDGEVSFKGLVRNDPQGENQSILSDYGAADTGAWVIEVHLDGEWEMEIG